MDNWTKGASELWIYAFLLWQLCKPSSLSPLCMVIMVVAIINVSLYPAVSFFLKGLYNRTIMCLHQVSLNPPQLVTANESVSFFLSIPLNISTFTDL